MVLFHKGIHIIILFDIIYYFKRRAKYSYKKSIVNYSFQFLLKQPAFFNLLSTNCPLNIIIKTLNLLNELVKCGKIYLAYWVNEKKKKALF